MNLDTPASPTFRAQTLRTVTQTALGSRSLGVVGAGLEDVSTLPGNKGCGSVRSFSCNEKGPEHAKADYYHPFRAGPGTRAMREI